MPYEYTPRERWVNEHLDADCHWDPGAGKFEKHSSQCPRTAEPGTIEAPASRTRGQRAVEREAARDINNRDDVEPALRAAMMHATNDPRLNDTALDVYVALCSRGIEVRLVDLVASHAYLMERADVPTMGSVRFALKQLEKHGYVKRWTPGAFKIQQRTYNLWRSWAAGYRPNVWHICRPTAEV